MHFVFVRRKGISKDSSFCKMSDWLMNTFQWCTVVEKGKCVGHEELVGNRFVDPGQDVCLRFCMCVSSELPLVFFVLRVPIGGHKGLPNNGLFPYKSQICFVDLVWKDKYVFKVNLGKGLRRGERIVWGLYNSNTSNVGLELTCLFESLVSF